MTPVIIVKNLNKQFQIGHQQDSSTLSKLLYLFSGREPRRSHQVLHDVSLTIHQGEIAGILGPNGAGKSTLLGVISGIYQQDSGYVRTEGHIVSVLGLRYGLKDRLSMRGNITLCCSLLGLSRADIRRRMDDIIDFTGLSSYADTKLYQFSSGMLSRLVLSIAVHSDPDILLLDEATSHLDREFKLFALETLNQLTKNGSTILMAGHEVPVMRVCHRLIWLSDGRVRHDGGTEETLNLYQKHYVAAY